MGKELAQGQKQPVKKGKEWLTQILTTS
jgi:hypothetical protein